MKALRKVTTTKEVKDLKGWTIPLGTTLHVMKEGPAHPREGYRALVVRVDNGTGDLYLMPETVVRDSDLGPGWKVGDLVWTRYGSMGRQPGRVMGFSRGSYYQVWRFSVNRRRWYRNPTLLTRGEILGLYDGSPLPGERVPPRRGR